MIKEIIMPINKVKRAASKGNDWLFELATRLAEFINTTSLIGFSFFMLIGLDELVYQYPYRKFTYASSEFFWLAVLSLGILQMIAMLRSSVRSNQASGIVLQISAIVWFVFAVTFGLDYPPISTALPIYSLLAFICAAGGHKLINANKENLCECKKNKDS